MKQQRGNTQKAMIDLIKLTRIGLHAGEITHIVALNRLQTNTRAGVIYYDNLAVKNLVGYYMRIETETPEKLKIETSLHKYFSFRKTGYQTNSDLFSFADARESVRMLAEQTGVELTAMQVGYYELGLNMILANDCKIYIDKMQTVGLLKGKRTLHNNPKYKGERIKTTEFDRDKKKVLKVYDKAFEMRDKKVIADGLECANILRIETTYKRVEGVSLFSLLNPDAEKRHVDKFAKDWRTVQFDPVIISPKGTTTQKIEICRDILKNGTEWVLNESFNKVQTGEITDRQYRYLRDYVQNWDIISKEIKILRSDEETEYRKELTRAIIDITINK